jgi:2-keto-4-pentenoate hydratase
VAARKDGLTVQPTPVSTLDEAYGIADATTAIAVAAGDRVIGHKIGLTDAAARAVFEAAEPAAEALLAGGALETGAPLTQPGERIGAIRPTRTTSWPASGCVPTRPRCRCPTVA